MRRFFAENISPQEGSVTLSGDEARHIRTVLRMKEGDDVLLIDGDGNEYLSCISELLEDSVLLTISDVRSCSAEPFVKVTLFQCLPKQGKMELIIQKCVELGAFRIVPIVSRRCIAKPDGKDNKLIRWNKVSCEAAKQCGRALVPEVTKTVDLSSVDLSGYELAFVAYENEGDRTLKTVLREHPYSESIAVIIGPEGGFEQKEVETLIEKGAVSVSLGKRILRTETAGMAVLAQIMYELEQ